MKLEHKLEPLMQVKEMSDNIQTYGCYRISLLFMLKPVGVVTPEQLTQLVTNMMKAACDTIQAANDEIEVVREGIDSATIGEDPSAFVKDIETGEVKP